jgi:hypothetical protein
LYYARVVNPTILMALSVQQIVGSFFYYACAVDPTIFIALSAIASQQALPTKDTRNRVNQFLDYMATNPDAKI